MEYSLVLPFKITAFSLRIFAQECSFESQSFKIFKVLYSAFLRGVVAEEDKYVLWVK